ncbi:MAG TPA: efflux transporter periplasmic adaptor subunit [Bacteroidales bacterium]|jgi:membrane fusion protein (multidrug efflux system)|nr:efflux transporter periplasmic adaptor subunit [Bacteroidales bacterium]
MALNNKKLIRGSITIVLIVIILGIIVYPKIKPMFNSDLNTDIANANRGSAGGKQVLFASGYVIKPTNMSEIIYSTGSLIPDEEVELSFETSGKVVGIFFKEGTSVKKGELLAKINDRPLQAQLLKLQAQLKLSQEREFRQRQLLERDAISRESYDQVATELQSLEADILLVEARISETELRAPFDGVVGLRLISEGAFANTQTKIVRLVKTSPLKIEFSIPERYSGEIAPGFPITFTLDGAQNEYKADVYAVDPKVDINTRTIAVRALYPNTRNELKPGRFTSVKARLSQIENTIAVPTQAIIPEMEGEKVFIFKNGKAQEVKVNLGLRTESLVQVREGLKFGDTLLTTAILQLRQNIPVQLDTLITNDPK